jgi:hypothetical protein
MSPSASTALLIINPLGPFSLRRMFRRGRQYLEMGATMAVNKCESLINREVERLFKENPAQHGDYCQNPVTLASYIHGVDPMAPQKEAAYRALLARECFFINAPADAQPLPLPVSSHLRTTLLLYIVALYARSLGSRNYDVKVHPSFAEYVSGVLWEAERGDNERGYLPNYGGDQLAKLKKRFPPRRLEGMGPGLTWLQPQQYAEAIARVKRHRAWEQSYKRQSEDHGVVSN